MPTSKEKLDDVSNGILDVQSLYAIYLGKLKAHEVLEADVAKKLEAAKAAFEKVNSAQNERVLASQKEVEDARQEVVAMQNNLESSLGVVVDVFNRSTGARVNL